MLAREILDLAVEFPPSARAGNLMRFNFSVKRKRKKIQQINPKPNKI